MENRKELFYTDDYKKTKNYLYYKLNYTLIVVREIIANYGMMNGVRFPNKHATGYDDRFQTSLNITSALIQKDWASFMKFYGNIKRKFRDGRRTSENNLHNFNRKEVEPIETISEEEDNKFNKLDSDFETW